MNLPRASMGVGLTAVPAFNEHVQVFDGRFLGVSLSQNSKKLAITQKNTIDELVGIGKFRALFDK